MRRNRESFDQALRSSSRGDVQDLSDSFYNLVSDGAVVNLTDESIISWNTDLGWNAAITLNENRTLAISNAIVGAVYNLIVTQDNTGSRTLALPANSKVFGGGAGAIILSPTPGAIDMLSAYYNGSFFFWTYALNFN